MEWPAVKIFFCHTGLWVSLIKTKKPFIFPFTGAASSGGGYWLITRVPFLVAGWVRNCI